MSQGMEAARTGMLQHERNLEVIANNLANVNTVGYKRLAVHFRDLLSTQKALDVLFAGADRSPSAGVELDATPRIFDPGALLTSGDPLSMAIVGDGFFPVRLDATTVAYTRDGTFSRDVEGFLVTTDGYRLEPPTQILGAVAELYVTPEGVVRRRGLVDDALEDVGQLQLALFADQARLQSVGKNLFVATAESGEAQLADPGTGAAGHIVAGMLETSNVNMATELSNLIVAQRAYQFNLVAFQTANEMLQQLNEATRT